MGTRSLIGMTTPSGHIQYIYCHWDGYPSNNGKILLAHYTDPQKVKELINLGDISSLGSDIGEKQDFERPTNRDWCVAYGRDRGDKAAGHSQATDEKEFRLSGHGSQYQYLFKSGKWYFSTGSFGFVELTPEACEES